MVINANPCPCGLASVPRLRACGSGDKEEPLIGQKHGARCKFKTTPAHAGRARILGPLARRCLAAALQHVGSQRSVTGSVVPNSVPTQRPS